jgi:hypothetical protein
MLGRRDFKFSRAKFHVQQDKFQIQQSKFSYPVSQFPCSTGHNFMSSMTKIHVRQTGF